MQPIDHSAPAEPTAARATPPDAGHAVVDEVEHALEKALNRTSAEARSNTPDFVLAGFLRRTLQAWEVAVSERDTWYGVELAPGKARAPLTDERAAEIVFTALGAVSMCWLGYGVPEGYRTDEESTHAS